MALSRNGTEPLFTGKNWRMGDYQESDYAFQATKTGTPQ